MDVPTAQPRVALAAHVRSAGAHGLVAALWVVIIGITPLTIIDDAFISFRYARNLATHGELVFNPGERVEGMTNLLWTLLLSAINAAISAPLPETAVVLALLLLLFTALRMIHLAEALGSPALLGALAGGALLLDRDVVLAATNGLEGALFMALLVEGVLRSARGQLVLAFFCMGLLFLTRPEGAAGGVLLLLVAASDRRPARDMLAGLAVFGAIVAGATIFRVLFYGSAVPNSVIAKSTDFQTIRAIWPHYQSAISAYSRGFASANPLFLVLLVAMPAIVWLNRRRSDGARGVVVFCLGATLGSWLIMARNGGDWMPNYRLLTQYAPLYLVPLLTLPNNARWGRWVASAGLASALVLGAFILRPAPERAFGLTIDTGPNNPYWGQALQRIAPQLAPGDSVSAEALGYIGYQLPNTRVHDPLGLADAYLARHGTFRPTFGRDDPNYTLGVVHPTILIWHYVGHVFGAQPDLLAQYAAFCAADCASWDADVVMVRNDRLAAFGPAFADWQRVHFAGRQVVPE